MELQINPVLVSCIRMSWDVQVPFLSENVIRCVSLLGLPKSGLFPLGRFFYSSLSWGSYRVHSFWSKFYPVYFNRDFAACLIFRRCTTSPAIFNRFLKSRVLGSLLPFSTKHALKSPPKILPSPCPL